MQNLYLSKLNTLKDNISISPKISNEPVTTTEKLVRKEVNKLDESVEEIKKLKEQLEKKKDGYKEK